MRIKKLVFQNINSLYGKWKIDFDCKEFQQSGIFAILGKTGSGKSTILDAMCLALYGSTPRLKKSTLEAISRGCNECMSELTFVDTEGREWTATYAYAAITRGGRKGQINENAIHKLSCNGKVEADKTTMVTKKVEEITGLDSTRFCRAVLLAQGSFDAFLNAGTDNGEILERITGTEIYSRIAEKLKERYDSEKNKLAAIEALFEGIKILPDEEVEQINQEIGILTGEIAGLSRVQTDLNQLIQKFQQLELHKNSLSQCNNVEKILSAEELEFTSQRKRLEDGKKVLEADERFRPFKELSGQQSAEETALQKTELRLKEQENLFAGNRKKLDSADEEAKRYQKEYETLKALLTAVNSLDTVIKTMKTGAAEAQAKREAETLKAWNLRKELCNNRKQLETLRKKNSDAVAYLAERPADGELAAVKKSCEGLLEIFKKYTGDRAENLKQKTSVSKELQKIQLAEDEKKKQLQTAVRNLEEISGKNEKAKQALDGLLNGATREHWEKLCEKQEQCYLQALTLRSLDEHRKRLKDGEECPLCGSKEHPFAMKNMPEPEKENEELNALKKRLSEIGNAEKLLQKILGEVTAAENARLQSQGELDQLNVQLKAKQGELNHLTESEQKIQASLDHVEKQITSALDPYSISWDRSSMQLPDALSFRIKAYADCKESLAAFEQEEDELKNAILRLQTTLKTLRDNCRNFRTEWKTAQEKLAGETAKRQELFGSKDPAVESRIADEKQKSILEMLEKAQKAFTEISTNRARTLEEISQKKKSISERAVQISQAKDAFLQAVKTAGITEEIFHASVLSKEELARLSAKDAELAARRKQLAETRANCEKSIAELNTALTGQKSKEELTAELEKTTGTFQEKNQILGALKEKLKNDLEGRQNMAEQNVKLQEQKKAMEIWNRMYDLIGSKDKFQRFAQGITLEHLLVLANVELEKLSGRYRLLRSQKEELGIDVADKDLGDEIRSCKTLSGGERFLVSLSLALGLSQMAGEKIRVDSLFLDEGFGTLDSETLETALEALSNLRNRGKLVGVISHVAAFSEKIPCIIEVHKTGGGRSTIHGTGVNLPG